MRHCHEEDNEKADSPLDRLASFAKRIVAVPKREVDEKAEAYRKQTRKHAS